ncbi:MAG: outer membrane lipoprotein chaperone LolA [Aeromonas sp.]
MQRMKNICVAGLLGLLSHTALADSRSDLQAALAKVGQFSAQFSQQVFDSQGKKLIDASGTLAVARPNRFHWHTTAPDESLIVADGQSVWLFDPLLEQVTVMGQAAAMQNTPLVLIAGNDPSLWQRYTVSGQAPQFTLTSTVANDNLRQFTIGFNGQGQLASLEVTERQGQRSRFTLSAVVSQPAPPAEKFRFVLPKGVTLDDQR